VFFYLDHNDNLQRNRRIHTFFPLEAKVNQLRSIIQKEVPNATETFKCAIPTFDLFGNLVHFAGYKHHIGFYPAPSGLKAFKSEIEKHQNSKGAVQFALDQELPLDSKNSAI